MLAATTVAIFIIPATFYLVEKFTMRFRQGKTGHGEAQHQPGVGD